MITATVIIAIIYAELIIWALIGINRLEKEKESAHSINNIPIGIIIPFRNEAQRISPLLKSLEHLINQQEIQIIFIDDQSDDGTADLIRKTLSTAQLDYQIILREIREGSPKKIAIEQAVKLIKHPWIVTLDADAELPATWFKGIKKALSKQPDLLLGPIDLKTSNNLLGTIQQIETAGISQLGRGKAGFNNPMVANGAHLAYNKAWFESVGGYEGNRQIASGDDMFLLKKALANKAKIHYLNDKDCLVKVTGAGNWVEFIEQRLRWLGKSKAVALKSANWAGIVISTANLWVVVLLVTSLYYWTPWLLFIAYVILKSIIDAWLTGYKPLYTPKWSLAANLSVNLIYPWLMLVIAVLNLKGRYHWKGRAYKK